METYGDLITQLMPCVLVSPDSLARFFPARAGHLRPRRLRRGIADPRGRRDRGDGPGKLRRRRRRQQADAPDVVRRAAAIDVDSDDAEIEPTIVEDEESILTECVQAGVPQHWLSWHYRSQDESLIAFSNAHYYEGRLSSFPAPATGAADPAIGGHGVSLVRVAGHVPPLRQGEDCCGPTPRRRRRSSPRSGGGSTRSPDGVAVGRRRHLQPAAARLHRGTAP